MSRRRGAHWRDEAAGRLVAKHLPHLGLHGSVLVMDDPTHHVADAFASSGLPVDRWWHRALGGREASAWPPPGPYDAVALRLPRAKDELEMWVHAALAALQPGGTLLVYGAKDEGIGSAASRIEPLTGSVRVVAKGGHCRVLAADRPTSLAGLRGDLAAWRTESPVDLPEISGTWISFPGVFAHGRVDPGTAMLLRSMPDPADGARVLDFGCGSGLVGAVAAARSTGVVLDALDVDAVALTACAENVPDARRLLADGLARIADGVYDLILSNPPYHRGKAESTEAVRKLVTHAPRVLRRAGRLVMVVQRRLNVGPLLTAAFPRVRVRDEDRTYRVWEGGRR